MGKLKDLVTEKTFDLVETAKVKVPFRGKEKEEESYTYYCKETDAKVVFCAHPTQAWNWYILPASNELGKLVASHVIEAFVKAALANDGKAPVQVTL